MAERTIRTTEELLDVLARVTFAPSCVDMGWAWVVRKVTVEGSSNGWLVSTTFRRPDRDTGEVATGHGREWFVAEGATESAVVKTAFAAAKMILEHELMEAFRFEGDRVFDPHYTVAQLTGAAIIDPVAGYMAMTPHVVAPHEELLGAATKFQFGKYVALRIVRAPPAKEEVWRVRHSSGEDLVPTLDGPPFDLSRDEAVRHARELAAKAKEAVR